MKTLVNNNQQASRGSHLREPRLLLLWVLALLTFSTTQILLHVAERPIAPPLPTDTQTAYWIGSSSVLNDILNEQEKNIPGMKTTEANVRDLYHVDVETLWPLFEVKDAIIVVHTADTSSTPTTSLMWQSDTLDAKTTKNRLLWILERIFPQRKATLLPDGTTTYLLIPSSVQTTDNGDSTSISLKNLKFSFQQVGHWYIFESEGASKEIHTQQTYSFQTLQRGLIEITPDAKTETRAACELNTYILNPFTSAPPFLQLFPHFFHSSQCNK